MHFKGPEQYLTHRSIPQIKIDSVISMFICFMSCDN